MRTLSYCRYRIILIVSLLVVFGYLDLGIVSSLSARVPQPNNSNNNNNNSIDPSSRSTNPSISSVSRRDWLVAGSVGASGLLWKNAPAAASGDDGPVSPRRPKLGDEYYNNPVASDPAAGRSYFPAITPPFQNRATYRYDLGRGAWALEQLLTFANVTATIRCNVVRLISTGGLWVHSPQWPTGEFCSLLDSIGGPVEHVVLPCNAFEHKGPMKAFLKIYPNAKVWIAPGQYGLLGKQPSRGRRKNEPIIKNANLSYQFIAFFFGFQTRELRNHFEQQQARDGIQGGWDFW
jgi:hypothetical protein